MINQSAIRFDPRTGTPSRELLRWMSAIDSRVSGQIKHGCSNVPIPGLKQEMSDTTLELSAALQSIVTANQDILELATSVDKKIESFYQANPPANPDYGDLWIDTDNGNRLQWFNGLDWQDGQDTQIYDALTAAANNQTDILSLATLVDGKVETYYQTTPPVSPAYGDLWINTAYGNSLWRWNGVVWEDGQDNGINSAIANASTALDAAALAQATADGKIVTFHQTSPPGVHSFGDIWLDSDDDNKMYRGDGSNWFPVQDGGIAQAIADASTAQSTADGKVVAFRQASPPTAEGIGDLWIDSDDDNRIYRWDSANWIDSHDPNVLAALTLAQNAYNVADGKIESYYQATAPISADVGDIWFDSDDENKMHRWSGTGWVSAEDSRIAQALADASTAQASADGKVTTYYQTTPPASVSMGDLWIDSNDNKKLYRFTGTYWLSIQDGDIVEAKNAATYGSQTFNQRYLDMNSNALNSPVGSNRIENLAVETSKIDGDAVSDTDYFQGPAFSISSVRNNIVWTAATTTSFYHEGGHFIVSVNTRSINLPPFNNPNDIEWAWALILSGVKSQTASTWFGTPHGLSTRAFATAGTLHVSARFYLYGWGNNSRAITNAYGDISYQALKK